ncbi:putative oxidoreductase GLYR1 homolog [Trichonephila clavata]|uniref:Cytokine-like nuclear factor N-PAC n=1 Tax=Trichonephila clavata TaxID=2740835 RepID=A0A8X6F1N4_TRICU|nr:putative oxidoreductase GLYR1 homolog [Trichonephila clavata]
MEIIIKNIKAITFKPFSGEIYYLGRIFAEKRYKVSGFIDRSKTKYNYFKMVAKKDFEIGDLVWAKMKNFPFWPARITLPPIVLEKDFYSAKGLQKKRSSTPRKAQHYVFFFGTKNYAWILDENIVPHSVEMLHNVSRKKSTSYVKAIDEIIAADSVSVPNLKLVKKELFENDASTENSIDEVVESTKKIKVEKTEESNKVDEAAKRFLDVWNTEKITKTETVKDDKLLKESPTVDFSKKSTAPRQKIKYGNTKKPVENIESANKFIAVSNLEKNTMTRGIKDDKLVKKYPAVDFVKKNITPKQRSKSEKTKELVQDDKSTKNFTGVRNLKKTAKIPSIKNDKLRKKSTVDFVKKSTTPKQKIKCDKTKEFVEDDKSPQKISAVKSLGKTTKIPSFTGDKLLKKSTFLSVKKGRTPKEKITCEKTKKPPQKRKLTEVACDKKLSPVRKLPRKVDDNFASISNTSRNTMLGLEPSPVPVLDMSRFNPIVKQKNIRATSKKIGFIGLGTMGQRIVKNLLESGHDVSIWNRTQEKCKQFVQAGAHQFLKPCDIVLNCDIIFSCIAGPKATKSVFFGNKGILQGLQKCRSGTKGFVVLSAVDPETSQAIAAAVTSNGGNYIEAPISGSISNAEEGSLLIPVAGNRELFDGCLTCFYAISKNAYHLSCDVGSASIMNIATSMVKSTAAVALAEGMSLVERMNLSKNNLKEVLDLSSITCRLFTEKGLAMATNNFTADHSLKYQQSNLKMMLELGNKYSQPMALASAANEVYKKAIRLKYSNHDMSAVYFGAKP